MPKYLLDNTKKYISTIKPSEVKTLFEYFDNSSEFTLHSEKRGLEIPLNTDSVTYVDSEMDDRNYYKEYIANDGGFIIRVDNYGIREGLIKMEGELFLEQMEGMDIEIYRK